MRLTSEEVSAIKTAVNAHFSSVSRILLFGSRVDDSRRGGDIDLLVETNEPPATALRHKLESISDIQFRLGERKIDMVLAQPEDAPEERAIVRIARSRGVPL